MALKVVCVLTLAVVLVVQGIYVLRTGQTLLFFANPKYHHPPVRIFRRLIVAFGYVFPVGMGGILFARANNDQLDSHIRNWLSTNGGFLIYILLLALSGAFALAQPARAVRWSLREHPALASDAKMLITMRLIGSGILLLALFMLAKL